MWFVPPRPPADGPAVRRARGTCGDEPYGRPSVLFAVRMRRLWRREVGWLDRGLGTSEGHFSFLPPLL